MSNYALSGGQEDIGGNESAYFGIVVPGLEVVEACLLVVNVPPVAEGVQHAQCGCQGARAAELPAPAVIAVFYHGVSAAVNDLDNVPLAVPQVIVLDRFISLFVFYHRHLASSVIGEPQRIAALREPDQHAAVVVVVRSDVVDRLLQPQPVLVVAVGDHIRPGGDPRQLLPAPGQSLASVGRRVPHGVVGDCLIAVAYKLVLPIPGGIGIRDRLRGRAGVCGRGIGIDALDGQVPPQIVGIRHRLVGEPVVLPDQLVGTVVFIGNGGRPPGDRGYVPVVVVGMSVLLPIMHGVGKVLIEG